MSLQHKEAQDRIGIERREVADAEEVAFRLGHLNVIDIDKTVMHPVANKRFAAGCLGLGDFIFVMRENQVLTTAVNIDSVAQEFVIHGRALNMPARSSLSPGGGPGRLAFFFKFPDNKVERAVFLLIVQSAGSFFQVVQRVAGEFAIVLELQHIEIDAIIQHIGIALIVKRLDHLNNFRNGFCRPRVNCGTPDIKSIRVDKELLNHAIRQFFKIHPFSMGPLNDLIVNIRKIHDIIDAVTTVFEVAAQGIKNNQGTGVAEMEKFVNGRSAYVDFVFSRSLWNQFFFAASKVVVNFHEFLRQKT